MTVRLLVILWSIWGALSLAMLAFIIFKPAAWASLVDRENDFWIRRGWLSTAFVGKMKSLEKGVIPKLFLAAMTFISIVVISTLLYSPPPRKLRAMPPPVVPIQRRQPGH